MRSKIEFLSSTVSIWLSMISASCTWTHYLELEPFLDKLPKINIGTLLGFLLMALVIQGGEGELRAQDSMEQSAVIGFTLLGFHDFSKSDELRESEFIFEDTAGYGHLFAEFYPVERLGF